MLLWNIGGDKEIEKRKKNEKNWTSEINIWPQKRKICRVQWVRKLISPAPFPFIKYCLTRVWLTFKDHLGLNKKKIKSKLFKILCHVSESVWKLHSIKSIFGRLCWRACRLEWLTTNVWAQIFRCRIRRWIAYWFQFCYHQDMLSSFPYHALVENIWKTEALCFFSVWFWPTRMERKPTQTGACPLM